jgi:hypothetical protein
MSQGIALFQQVQAWLSRPVFARAVARCHGDHKVHVATCWSHFCCLALALLTHRRSLRCIETSFSDRRTSLSAWGIGSVYRSTLSHANARRPAQVVTALFPVLAKRCDTLLTTLPRRFRRKLYLLDATVIGLCETLFDWACWAPKRSGVKLHVVYDADGHFPCVVNLTSVRVNEIRPARALSFALGTILCFDRGYFDTTWFQQVTDAGVTFVTRMATHVAYEVVQERRPDPDRGVMQDAWIRFTGERSRRHYRGRLRCIHYVDPHTERTLVFVTNRLRGAAYTICEIYRARWQIEAFFKWLKTTLQVKTFYGRSENAVRWQLWTALCLYLWLTCLCLQARRGWTVIALFWRIDLQLFNPVNLHDLFHMKTELDT